MYRSIKKYLAILLAILLGLAPLQNLMAVSIACAESDNMPGHLMDRMVSQQESVMSELDIGVEQNVSMDCCNDGGCAPGHCVTSTATLYTTIVITTTPQMNSYVSPHVSLFLSQTSSPLFRPPRA